MEQRLQRLTADQRLVVWTRRIADCRSRGKGVLPENVSVDVVEHRILEEKGISDECGTAMQEIGKEVRRTLQIVPAYV